MAEDALLQARLDLAAARELRTRATRVRLGASARWVKNSNKDLAMNFAELRARQDAEDELENSRGKGYAAAGRS